MTAGPLIVEILITFVVSAFFLYQYGNWYRHHIIVTLSVLIAWYFSMLIVFILPLDVTNTIYENYVETLPTPSSLVAADDAIIMPGNQSTEVDSNVSTSAPDVDVDICYEPWSLVPPRVFPIFWRIVYWTSQLLTWIVLPLMQSYTRSGDFTVWTKLKSALIDNAIYYGSYMLIVGILLLYIALRPNIYLDESKLRVIAATASNTWGLFLLVLLLGYGLVELPRNLWHSASISHNLNYTYFKAAKLSHEKAEASDHLNDLLQSMRALSGTIGVNHPLRSYMDVIENKVPAILLDKVRQLNSPDSPHVDVPSEKALVRLHKQLIKALQHHNRVETQWQLLIDRVYYLEDIHHNSLSSNRYFKHLSPVNRPTIISTIYTPVVEWYWKCQVWPYLLKVLAVVAALVSCAVVWSELTLFSEHPPLSLFAIIVSIAKANCGYFTIEVISSLTMAYIALCAYSTLFKVRVLNLYYLAPHHQTDEYSLIFAGMMLCRLTPPMCLNFLSLIHMDSHVIKVQAEETHYTQIMGHMDVISIINDGFNIYFPMMIVALCLATYYSLGSMLLSAIGFQQFVGDDELTTDLIDEGKTLIAREFRRKQRHEESVSRRREFVQKFGDGENAATLYRAARHRAEDLVKQEGPSIELLGGSKYSSYSSHLPSSQEQSFVTTADASQTRSQHIDTTLFDDI